METSRKYLTLWIALALTLLNTRLPTAATADEYRYMSGAQLEERIKAKEPVVVLDIQVEEEFREHHIVGAVPTHAYPVKSDADRRKLQAGLEQIRASDAPVVIVCPRGAGGTKRTYDHLRASGVSEQRLYILEKGQAGWNCEELTVAEQASTGSRGTPAGGPPGSLRPPATPTVLFVRDNGA